LEALPHQQWLPDIGVVLAGGGPSSSLVDHQLLVNNVGRDSVKSVEEKKNKERENTYI
jgi:hypothetical protein